MTKINPVSMSTPIKSMQFNQMLPPPPDSSDSHHISNNSSNNNNIHLNSNDINNKIVNIFLFFIVFLYILRITFHFQETIKQFICTIS